jgi:uncharacterized damage-inducible protein DinB
VCQSTPSINHGIVKYVIETLKRGLQYDLWANKLWLECLLRTEAGETDLAIFQHILGAQKAWALRCHGISVPEPPKPELTVESMEEIHKLWMQLLDGRDIEQMIPYKRYNGDPNEMELSWIAQHVINHGTYHRGELRGMRRAREDMDFPDTDIAVYAFVVGGAKSL